MSLLVLLALMAALLGVLASLVREIRTDGYGHHVPPHGPSAFDPRPRLL